MADTMPTHVEKAQSRKIVSVNEITEHGGVPGSLDSIVEIGKVALPNDMELDAVKLPETQKSSSSALNSNIPMTNFSDSEDCAIEKDVATDEDYLIMKNRYTGRTDALGQNTDDILLDRLTSGILTTVLPQHEKLKKQLSDIIQSQDVLIETLGHENSKFRETQMIRDVTAIMDKAKIYQMKLVNIKKEMMLIHEKNSQLKKRALRLQQQKQKEALHKEHQRDEELDKEKKLTAKVVLQKT